MIPQAHVQRCLGKWVICHTRQGSLTGVLEACGGDHLILYRPARPGLRYMAEQLGQDEVSKGVQLLAPAEACNADPVSYGYAYGGFAAGRTAVSLAAIVGLTIIGTTALVW